jgi:hypothetical protein
MRSNGRPSHHVLGNARIPGHDLHTGPVEVETREILTHADKAGFIAVERDQFDVGELQEMRRLAAGRGACVEHALSRRRREERRRDLRAQILNGKCAGLESGQGAHVHRGFDDDARFSRRAAHSRPLRRTARGAPRAMRRGD